MAYSSQPRQVSLSMHPVGTVAGHCAPLGLVPVPPLLMHVVHLRLLVH